MSGHIHTVTLASLLGILLAAAPAALAQTTWYVDDDAPLGGNGQSWDTAFECPQDALAVASAADEVRIAGGTYWPDRDEAGVVTPGNRNETFQLLDGVTIAGGYRGLAGGGDPNDRDVAGFETVLSGEIGGPAVDDNSYHVVTASGTGPTAELDGVAVAHGFAQEDVDEFEGAGAFIVAGSPTLRSCTIRDNHTGYLPFDLYVEDGGEGAGLYCRYGSPVLVDCLIENNTSHPGLDSQYTGLGDGVFAKDGGNGAGLYFEQASPILIGCRIAGNQTGRGGHGTTWETWASPGAHGGAGAGVALHSCPQALFVNCIINGNGTGEGGDGGDNAGSTGNRGGDGGPGAGVHVEASTDVLFVCCTLTGNVSGVGGEGGDSADFAYPDAAGGDGGDAAAVCLVNADVLFINCLLADNATGDGGDAGAVLVGDPADGGDAGFGAGVKSENSTLSLVNCSVARNITGVPGEGLNPGDDEGGGIHNTGGSITIDNSILWNNQSAGTLEEQQLIGGAFTINYSCVEGWTGGLGGTGNIDADPLFVDPGNGDYHFQAGSPCIDAGDNDAVPGDVTTDLDGNDRFVDDTGMPDDGNGTPPIVDMGAYEFQGTTCFGDLTGDDAVDLADLAQLLGNYGTTTGAVYTDGDLDRDGDVDLADLAELLSVYGTTCP